LIYFVGANSQNLVLNPSFESLNAGSVQCSWYTTQAGFNNAINNWTCPTGGSSDIFVNSLATTCFCSPNSTNASAIGTQAPRTGTVMVGGSLYGTGGCSPYREYFQGKLTTALVAGTTYKIEFYLSLGDKSNVGSNNIGVKFSTTPVNVTSMCVYSVVPDVNYTGAPITNKTGWDKIEFCYTPTTSGLLYFMIGNFYNNVATTVTTLTGSNNNAYYYLDDVSIVPSSSVSVNPTANLTSNCSSSSATLSALPASVNYTWTAPSGASVLSGINSQNASIQGNGVYTLSVQNPSACVTSVVSTTILVNTASSGLSVTASAPSSITCSTPTTVLTATATSAASYTWTGPGVVSGANTASVIVNLPGTYSVTVTNTAGCSGTATTSVAQNTVVPAIIISPSSASVSCSSPTVQLSSTVTPATSTYTWSASSGGSLTSSSISNPIASGVGVFTLTAINPTNGCVNSETVSIVPSISSITLSVASASICNGSSTVLSVNGNATSYSWTPSSSLSSSIGSSVTANPSTTTTYTVIGSTGTCSASTLVTVTVQAIPSLTITPLSQTVCLGQSASIAASGGPTYSWSPANSLNSASGSNVIATPTVVTVYTITSGVGTCSSSAQATVEVTNNPLIALSGNTLICSGATTSLSANGVGNYTWSPASNLSSSTGSLVTANPSVTTNYTVSGSVSTCTAVAFITVSVSPLPVLIASTSQSICAGSSATLNVSGALTYSWNPSNNLSSASGSTVNSTPLTTTSYTISGSDGLCSNTATTSVIVNPVPTIIVNPLNPTICVGASTNLIATGATNYTWSPAFGLNTTSTNSVVASPSITTTYTIDGSNLGCVNQTVVTVSVNALPVLSISPNATICAGASTNFTVSGANTYNWLPTIGLTPTFGANVTSSPLSSLVYTVSGSSLLGCSNTITVSVDVVPIPTISIVASPSIICEGNSSILQASGATNYTWSPSPSLVSNGSSASVNPFITSVYSVTATNGAVSQCISTQTITVVVTPSITVTVPYVSPICFGQSTFMFASGGTSYTWSPSQGVNFPNQPNTSVSPSVTTIYTVTASNFGLCTSQSTLEIVVYPLPVVNAGRDTTINIDEIVTLNGTGNVEVGFMSTNGLPLDCNYCDAITVNPQESTCYLLRGISAEGCVAYDDVCVTVTKDWNIYIPNAFTPNNDIHNEVFIPVGYGISEIKLRIFDRWGAQIFVSDGTNIGWDGKMKGKVCEQGVYTYQAEIKTMAGNSLTKVGHVTLLPR
jgi:gliding motility-associated-like protein